MSNGDNIEKVLKAGLRRLSWATVIVYIALIALGGWAWDDATDRRQELAEVAHDTNQALCSLRDDVERRMAASEQFLAEHPKGIPGISAETLRTSIENQQRTVAALSGLECS